MKAGVSSYSFARLTRSGEMDIKAVIAKTAEIGFEGIEFSGIGVKGDDPKALPLARDIRKACDDAGLTIMSYTIGADFLRAEGGWQGEAKRLEGEVRVAAELGAPCMRHDATRGWPAERTATRTFQAALPLLAEGCRAVTRFAAGLGVRTMVENHGFFAQDSDRCEQLTLAVDDENFGSLVDVGNFLCADEEPVPAVQRMAPYAFHCHVKDFHVKPATAASPGKGWFRSRGGSYLRGAIIGHGCVDVPACLRAMRQGGYDGFVSIEFEGMEDNVQALQIGLDNLRRYIDCSA